MSDAMTDNERLASMSRMGVAANLHRAIDGQSDREAETEKRRTTGVKTKTAAKRWRLICYRA